MSATFCRQCGVSILELTDGGLCAGCEEIKAKPDGLSRKQFIQVLPGAVGSKVPFKDMKQMDEDDRINLIATEIRKMPGKLVAVMVDKGPGYEGKGDRYISKLKAVLPEAKLMARANGPGPGCETMKFKL